MKRYTEPDCCVIVLNMSSIICGSLNPGFDAIDATEEFIIDAEELI